MKKDIINLFNDDIKIELDLDSIYHSIGSKEIQIEKVFSVLESLVLKNKLLKKNNKYSLNKQIEMIIFKEEIKEEELIPKMKKLKMDNSPESILKNLRSFYGSESIEKNDKKRLVFSLTKDESVHRIIERVKELNGDKDIQEWYSINNNGFILVGFYL